MTNLVTATPLKVSAGLKCISMRMTSGDARIQMSVDGNAYEDIASSVKTADAGFNITIPECYIQSVITGDAVVSINRIS